MLWNWTQFDIKWHIIHFHHFQMKWLCWRISDPFQHKIIVLKTRCKTNSFVFQSGFENTTQFSSVIFPVPLLSSLAWNELKVEIEYTSAESWRDKSLLWTHQEMQEVGRRLAETQKVLTFEIINETSHELPASKNWICFSQSQSSMLAYKCNGSIYANFRPFFICPVLLSLSSLVVLHNLMRNCSKSCPE